MYIIEDFQGDVGDWLIKCFGKEIASDITERNYRFLEEALELVQSNGCSKEDCLKLVDYVYSRPKGEINQEVGGVMVTLAALCEANSIDLATCSGNEVNRVLNNIEKIRAKHFSKKIRSALPGNLPLK